MQNLKNTNLYTTRKVLILFPEGIEFSMVSLLLPYPPHSLHTMMPNYSAYEYNDMKLVFVCVPYTQSIYAGVYAGRGRRKTSRILPQTPSTLSFIFFYFETVPLAGFELVK